MPTRYAAAGEVARHEASWRCCKPFQRSGSNVDDPLAVVRVASRPRRVGQSKIARIDDFLSTNAKLLHRSCLIQQWRWKGDVHEQYV
jgi:hypothetical protein